MYNIQIHIDRCICIIETAEVADGTCYLAILSFIHLSLMPCSVNMCERRREVMWLKRSPLIGSTDLGTLPPLMNNFWPLEMLTGSISDCGWERNSIRTHSETYTTPRGKLVTRQYNITLSLLFPSKIQGMMGGHGLGRACDHIKALESPNPHIKGNYVLKVCWADMPMYAN